MRFITVARRLMPAAVLLALASCLPPFNSTEGALTISIGAPAGVKTIVPGISMTASSYVVAGVGPGGQTFSTVTSGTSATISGLAKGTWSVTVDGQNSSGIFITHGAGSVTVVAGTMQTVVLSVAPIAGPGTLSLAASWPAAQVLSPSIQAQLIPVSGAAIPLAFSVDASAGSASWSSNAVINGYYTLTIQLMDGTTPVMGAVDVAQVAAGQTTSGTYAFSSVNTARGSILVSIAPQLTDPIPVTISGAVSQAAAGTTVDLGASVPAGTGTVTCVWYLNGASAATGPSMALNTAASPLAPGAYRVDVTAFSADGLRAGSASTTLTVFPAVSVTLAWNANTETDLAGYNLYLGQASGVYGAPIQLGPVLSTTVGGLMGAHAYYFALTAYDSLGRESPKSAEVLYTTP